MKLSVDFDAETAREIAKAAKAVRETKATLVRLAVRAGLPAVVTGIQAPAPPGTFAAQYRRRRPEREQLETAMARMKTGPDR